MTNQKMTRDIVNKITADANEALQALADKYGMRLEHKGGRFDDGSFTPKFTFHALIAGGQPVKFADDAYLLNMPTDCWGKKFESNGRIFTVHSINRRARKYPVVGEDRNGRLYKFKAAAVRNGFLHGLS